METKKTNISIYDIKDPAVLHSVSESNMDSMIKEARQLIIDASLKNGGHWGANTSILEASAAVVRCFDLEKDKILFDIGHNSYGYKIFTGRANRFMELRNLGGIKGFQDMHESKYDVLEQGNAGTASSNALGMAAANVDKNNFIVTIVGDSTFGNGTVYEFFNHSKHIKKPVIFLLNDNAASIGPTVGGFQSAGAKDNQSRVKGFLNNLQSWTDMFGFELIGPIDGHDWRAVEKALNKAKDLNQTKQKSALVYLLTEKGHGITGIEGDVSGSKFHAIGRPRVGEERWDPHISKIIAHKMQENDKIDIVSSAMLYPMSLNITLGDPKIKHVPTTDTGFQRRVYNVGIAEGHAASFAAGLALGGRIPYLPYQSAFARRAFDHILHDSGLTYLHLVIGLAEAGVIENGGTHHGFYDLPMFNAIPNTSILQPSNLEEMKLAYDLAFAPEATCIWVIRYAKYVSKYELEQTIPPASLNLADKSRPLWIKYPATQKTKIAIISYGHTAACIRFLIKKHNLPIDLYSALWLKPIDFTSLKAITKNYSKVILAEETLKYCGLSSMIAQFTDITKITVWAFPDNIVLPFGEEETVRGVFDLDEKGLEKRLLKLLATQK